MKTIISILLLCFFIPAMSQKTTRLNGYAVYVFDDQFDSYYSNSDYYNGKFKGGLQWGVGIEFLPTPMNGIELIYLNQQTTAPTNYWAPGQITEKHTNFDVGFNWAMLAFNRYMRKQEVRWRALVVECSAQLLLMLKTLITVMITALQNLRG